MKPIFEYDGKEYYNEQDIIDAGTYVIYWYCGEIKGRWRDIEPIMIDDACDGYYYASDVMEERYEPELETLYLMKHSGTAYGEWYVSKLINETA